MYELYRQLNIDDDGVWSVELTSEGALVAASGDSLSWWSVESGERRRSLQPHRGVIVSTALDRSRKSKDVWTGALQRSERSHRRAGLFLASARDVGARRPH